MEKKRREFTNGSSVATSDSFCFTPKHCSWLNQIENRFSGLSRRVLKRGDFDSVQTLQGKILNYIDFYNQTAGDCR